MLGQAAVVVELVERLEEQGVAGRPALALRLLGLDLDQDAPVAVDQGDVLQVDRPPPLVPLQLDLGYLAQEILDQVEEGGVIAHRVEEVVEGQQDGALPLVGVTTANLEIGFGHGPASQLPFTLGACQVLAATIVSQAALAFNTVLPA